MVLLACALPAWAAAPAPGPSLAPAVDVRVERVAGTEGGKVYRIGASGAVAATPAAAWRTLTDYAHLADFVPGLTRARVVSRDGDTVIVEQQGTASFLIFSQPIRLVVRVHEQMREQMREQAPSRIDIGLVEGDMKVYRASWELVPQPGGTGTKVVYYAAIEPQFYVPAMIGTTLVRKDIARMMAAVLSRMERQE
jgi:carbon monoxide dehydrogenase subunit G